MKKHICFAILILSLMVKPSIAKEVHNEIFIHDEIQFEKGINIKLVVKTPIPIDGENSKLCFLIGEIENQSDYSLQIKKLYKNTFGEEEYNNVYTYSPVFIKGSISDSKGSIHNFKGNREIMTHYPENGKINVFVCSRLVNYPDNVISFSMTALQKFKAIRIIWVNQAGIERDLGNL